MSAIAQFHVIPSERLPEIVAAATPVRTSWFRPPRDTFWDVLRTAGRELERFGWSGWAFNTLDLYLESRHGLMYSNFGDSAPSRQLSKVRGSYWLVIAEGASAELLKSLDPIVCQTADLTAFLAAEHGPDGVREEVVAVQAALTALKAWLAKVPPGWTGLLSIG
jgi:hypothetical protein